MLTTNIKLIEFQFKITHRVYASDSYVLNFDNTVSKLFILCKVDDSIPHLFVDCIKVDNFWKSFKTWLINVTGRVFPITTVDIIFGILRGTVKSVNFCILHAKWFIHINKEADNHVNFVNL